MLADCVTKIKQIPIESLADEVRATQDNLSNVEIQLCELVEGMLVNTDAEIAWKLDGIHSLRRPHKEAQRNERHALLESAFNRFAVDYQDFIRMFSDTTTRIARWLDDCVMWFEDFTGRLSGHNFEQDFRDGDNISKGLLFWRAIQRPCLSNTVASGTSSDIGALSDRL